MHYGRDVYLDADSFCDTFLNGIGVANVAHYSKADARRKGIDVIIGCCLVGQIILPLPTRNSQFVLLYITLVFTISASVVTSSW